MRLDQETACRGAILADEDMGRLHELPTGFG
jgi:hypothetical protein